MRYPAIFCVVIETENRRLRLHKNREQVVQFERGALRIMIKFGRSAVLESRAKVQLRGREDLPFLS